MLIPVLLALLVCAAAGLIVAGIALTMAAPDPVEARLAPFSRRTRTLQELELQQPFSERVLRPMLQRLARGMQRVNRRGGQIDEHEAGAIQRRLNLAGNPHRWTPSDFLGVKTLGAIIGAGLIFLLLTAARQPAMGIIGAGVGALIGFMLPELYLRQLIGQRKDEILRALPDALDLLCISVEAGLGFDGALGRLVQKTDNALTREFGKVLQEVRVGRPRREALKEVMARTDVPDLANFISAVVQADQLGVSVTQVLSVQSDQMRVSRRQRAQEKAAQAPLKMLFPMMIFIFPALCVVILGPLWPQIAAVSFPR